MRRFRFKRHGLILIGGGLLTAAVWLFCFPVPVGWAVRAGLRRALPADAPVSVLLDGATLRWQLGKSSLRVDLGGVAVRRGGEPLADMGAVVLEIDKRGLRQGRYAPVLVDLVEPRLVADLRTLPGAETADAAAVAPAMPEPAASFSTAQLGALAALLPDAERPAVIRANGLKLTVRNRGGVAEWEFPTLETRAVREAKNVKVEFDAALAGESPAPAAAVRVSLGLEDGRGRVTLRIPNFNTERLPSWPGRPAVPLRSRVESEITAELDLAHGKITSLQGGLLLTDGLLTVPELAAPVAISRVEFKARAAGDPLQVQLETGLIEIAGARVELEGVQAVIGSSPRITGKGALRNVRASEWIALLPPQVRAQLPVPVDATALLTLESATAEGSVDIAADALGGWLPVAVDLKGEILAANVGPPLRLVWTARQPAGGEREVRVELAPFVPAEWGGPLFANSPAGALRLPVSASATATLDASAIVQRARVELRGGPGVLAAWGPVTRPVAVQSFTTTMEVEEGGRLLRLPAARLELDGPVMTLDRFSITLPEDDTPVEASGGVRLERISAAWAEAWLPPQALAGLGPLGLRPSEVQLDRLALDLKARLQTVDGQPKLLEGEATMDVAVRLLEQPLVLSGQATFVPASQRFDAAFEVAKFEPARLRLTLPAGAPPLAALDFPVTVRGRTSVGLDGKLGAVGFGLTAGPGTLRAFGPIEADVPLKEFAIEGDVSADFKNFTARTLNVEVGTALRLRGRELAWQGGVAPTVHGELTLDAVALPGLFPLLPADLQKEARAKLQAADLRGARVEFAATAAPQEPGGWRVDRATGTVGLERIRVELPASGPVVVERAEVELDYPRAEVRVAEATLGKFFTGPVSLTGRIDAADREALRAELQIDGARARLVAQPWEKIALVGQPLAVTATLKGTEAAEFRLATTDLLGKQLLIEGAARRSGDGLVEADLARVDFGRSALAMAFRQKAADRYAVKLTGGRLDVEEVLHASAPFLVGLDTSVGQPSASATAIPATPADSPPSPTLEFGVELSAVDFGAGRTVSDLRVSGILDRGWPRDVAVTGREGTANALRAELGGGGVTQGVRLEVADASAWLATLAMPLRELKLPPSPLADSAAQLVKIPSLVAGGRVELSGELAARQRFTGTLHLENATIVRAPRVLQLLALKSGKSLAQSPLIERLDIDRIAYDPKGISVEGLAFAGTGLIDRVEVKSANYQLGAEKLGVDGVYFGVGFEVVGTRADPQVFLKDDNLLIRAVGQRNEFDFEAMAEDEKAEKAERAERAKKE